MNELDALILVVMGLSALLGAIRGMLTEVLSLLVWVAALWLTVAFGDAVAAEFTGIETPLLRSLAGHGATFALVVIVGNLLAWLLRALLHGTGLSGTDRALGLGFGAVRGYAIVLAGVLLVSFTPWSRGALWRESTLMPLFIGPSGWIVAQLPDRSALVAFARPALDALPARPDKGAGPAAEGTAIGQALPGLPGLQGVDLAQAAQWAGLAVQGGFGPGATPPVDPASVAGDAPPGGDPAAVPHSSTESP